MPTALDEPVPLDILPPSIDVPSCCGSDAPPTAADAVADVTTRFHFSLNVSNFEKSVEFYRKLFGVPLAKHYSDYAKFELAQPPLVFSLVPNTPPAAGALSHFGFPVASLEEVEAVATRLRDAGLDVSCQNGTVCGYARQDKIWVADPDHNYWEVYVVYEDIDPATVRAAFDGISPLKAKEGSSEAGATRSPIVWEHRVTDPAPARVPYDDASIDEVRLTGTFNGGLSDADRRHVLAEARRILKPGGVLTVHGLVASEPVTGGPPHLPGVVALVKRVPLEEEPLEELRQAGFVSVQVTKLPQAAVFQQGTAEFRELKASARNPSAAERQDEGARLVVYKGPFAEARDDSGAVYVRGRRTEVSPRQWNDLARSAAASQFLFIDGRSSNACGQ